MTARRKAPDAVGRVRDPRWRAIASAAELLASRGLNATSIRDVAKHAGSPLGSTYHHFPGGKQQLVREAVEAAGRRLDETLERSLSSGLETGLSDFFAFWRERLLRSEFRVGCTVMAVAIEEAIDDSGDEVIQAAQAAFSSWSRRLSNAFINAGASPERAASLATLCIASIEGAVALCRAHRSIAPFDCVAEEMQQAIARVVPDAGSSKHLE